MLIPQWVHSVSWILFSVCCQVLRSDFAVMQVVRVVSVRTGEGSPSAVDPSVLFSTVMLGVICTPRFYELLTQPTAVPLRANTYVISMCLPEVCDNLLHFPYVVPSCCQVHLFGVTCSSIIADEAQHCCVMIQAELDDAVPHDRSVLVAFFY